MFWSDGFLCYGMCNYWYLCYLPFIFYCKIYIVTITFSFFSIIMLVVYIYTFTESGKRWTGEIDDTE
ncbi:hypothetical protein Barb6_00453 [Bacteroidales bacterium Barb6]|nr:hypothetical protein Barb6_00453 [Bacteroidales bacterium Barb6]